MFASSRYARVVDLVENNCILKIYYLKYYKRGILNAENWEREGETYE